MRGLLAILLVSSACGKHATCEEAVDHMIGLMLKEAPADRQEKIKQDRDKQVGRCKDDKPTQAVLDCVAKVDKLDAVTDCMKAPGAGEGKAYAKKAKTSEAVTMVKRIYMGARAYYEEKQMFPRSVGPTPPLGACCAGGQNGTCAPAPALWNDPTWQALLFSVDDPHHYSYVFTSAGEGPTATFSVAAHGDLDCNGVYSTFEMVGSLGPDGTITGAAGLFKDHELE